MIMLNFYSIYDKKYLARWLAGIAALETIPTNKIHKWFKNNIGRSVQAKRVEINALIKKKEQKQNPEFVL